MLRKVTSLVIVSFIASGLFNVLAEDSQAEEIFVTIGSGDFSGVYFPAGLAIAKMINDIRDEHGIRATVESTPGSVFNLNALASGYLEFGLAQADKQYQAVNGLEEWSKKGPQKNLRALFSLHNEAVTLVAAMDADINSIMDLRGKKVNLGNLGSGQHENAVDVLEAVGIDPKRDIIAQHVRASEAPALLIDGQIDAFFCTVGHPSETVRLASSGERKVRILPITGPDIDKLIGAKKHYSRTTIPAYQFYPGIDAPAVVNTFGVIATLCSSIDVPEEVVYFLTKVVFQNLENFRLQHPAFRNLTRKGMLQGSSAPLHPGAVRYFREAGLLK